MKKWDLMKLHLNGAIRLSHRKSEEFQFFAGIRMKWKKVSM
jgi:hypothetical protein